MRTSRSLFRSVSLVVCVGAGLFAARSAFAVLTTDNTNIGKHPNYSTNYSGFWRTGDDYSVLTDGTNTYVNAPSANGAIFFRAGNTGPSGNDNPTGNIGLLKSNGTFEVNEIFASATDGRLAVEGHGTAGQGVFGVSDTNNGVEGLAQSGSPSAGVYGYSHATNQALGVFGNVTGANSVGTEGQSDVGIGVFGNSSNGTNGWGVVGANQAPGWNGSSGGAALEGAAEGAGGWGVYGRCISNCSSTNGGLAGRFDGVVSINNGGLSVNGTCVSGNCGTSDARLKKNVQSLTGALDRIVSLRPVTFEWKDPDERGRRAGTQKGFIAQEVEKVMPEWVGVDDAGFRFIDTKGIEATAMLVESIRTLKAENDSLKARMSAVERGRAPVVSYLPASIGGLALGLVPFGFVAGRRKRENGAGGSSV